MSVSISGIPDRPEVEIRVLLVLHFAAGAPSDAGAEPHGMQLGVSAESVEIEQLQRVLLISYSGTLIPDSGIPHWGYPIGWPHAPALCKIPPLTELSRNGENRNSSLVFRCSVVHFIDIFIEPQSTGAPESPFFNKPSM